MNLKRILKYAGALVFIGATALAITPLHRIDAPELQTKTSRLSYRSDVKASQSDDKEPKRQELKMTSLGKFDITFYCPCELCCGKSPDDEAYGITATGTVATAGHTIAVDPDVIAFESRVIIEGMDYVYHAEDRGGAIKQNRIDIFVDSHEEALQLGRKTANVWLIEETEEEL